jgi:hypothetical protein
MAREALAACAATEVGAESMARMRKTTRVSSSLDIFCKIEGSTVTVDIVVDAYEFAYFCCSEDDSQCFGPYS